MNGWQADGPTDVTYILKTSKILTSGQRMQLNTRKGCLNKSVSFDSIPMVT
jgi:hypothetical protein